MDLRVGQRPLVEPPPEPSLLALQHTQRLPHHLFLGAVQPQRSVEPMRVKIELRPLSPSLPSASPDPSLHPQSPPRPRCPCFLGGRPSPQLSMDTMPELQVGQQEQELRQLLNKDKSKRSKDGGLPSPGSAAPCVGMGGVGAVPARVPHACFPGTGGEGTWG